MRIRKISAHYAFLSNGEFVKYPVITFTEEVIVDISFSNSLNEIEGLEFYSGILFPFFFDKIMLSGYDELLNHSSFKSPFVSKMVVPDGFVEKRDDKIQLMNKNIVHLPNLVTPMNGMYDGMPLFDRIPHFVANGFFKNYSEAFQYYTAYLLVKSELAIGEKPAFILCNEMSFLNSGSMNSPMLRVIR